MKRSSNSPASASMRCASRSVPSVATTSAWVSPRVNSAEPWVRGSTPVRISIGRTVRVSRPSMRGSPARIWPRTMRGFDLEQQAFDLDLVELDAFGLQRGQTLLVTSRQAWVRACLLRIW
jgi:hypothetical protein